VLGNIILKLTYESAQLTPTLPQSRPYWVLGSTCGGIGNYERTLTYTACHTTMQAQAAADVIAKLGNTTSGVLHADAMLQQQHDDALKAGVT
jgi:hypothetical protein